MLFSGDRRQMREIFFRAWRRHRNNEPVEGIERLIVDVALLHPEYQALLDDPEQMGEREFLPELGEANPFLHMSMHIAIAEQLSIDRPKGVRNHYQELVLKTGDEHATQHQIMECLGETLWRAQHAQRPPDESEYLECITRLCHNKGHLF